VNPSLAAHYFKRAADQGDPQAQFNYGTCLMGRTGIPMNPSLRTRYLQLAADQGSSSATVDASGMEKAFQ
jgi:TPR repeat protein